MAKKNTKEPVPVIGLPIHWMESPSPSLFANQMIVQTDEHNCYLSFYEIVPPLVMGIEAEQKKHIEELGGVNARCVARIVISADKMQKFADAIQETASKHGAVKEAYRNANGKEK